MIYLGKYFTKQGFIQNLFENMLKKIQQLWNSSPSINEAETCGINYSMKSSITNSMIIQIDQVPSPPTDNRRPSKKTIILTKYLLPVITF